MKPRLMRLICRLRGHDDWFDCWGQPATPETAVMRVRCHRCGAGASVTIGA